MRAGGRYELMVVEDNDEDFTALTRVLTGCNGATIVRCRDGEEAIHCLGRKPDDVSAADSQRPSRVILLDLNLPGTDGREVLCSIKSHPQWRAVPVVVLSTSSSPADIRYCYEHGANGYMLKSLDYTRFEASIRLFCQYWNGAMLLPPG